MVGERWRVHFRNLHHLNFLLMIHYGIPKSMKLLGACIRLCTAASQQCQVSLPPPEASESPTDKISPAQSVRKLVSYTTEMY